MTTTATMTTTTMTTTTTERRIRMTVQNRLTITVAILSVLALTVVGLVLYTVEANNVEGRNTASMAQEVAEMRSFAQNGVDPETGERFTSVDQILSQFLAQNRPDEDETLFAFLTDGRVLYQGEPNSAVNGSAEFEKAVAGVSADGGEINLTIDGDEYDGYVLPITSGPGEGTPGGSTAGGSKSGADNGPGSFVVVHNVTASHTDLSQVMQIYIVVALAAALLISGISSVLARRLLAPVTELRKTAQSISGGDLSSRLATRGNDDIAELGRTFNDMLDRLEASFETQKRFLDDVGHELRTPLTILSGHLETMDSSDVDDVDETRTMLLDETDRMARLVEELLILARSRRPDFVRPGQVDVPSLLNETLAKAKGLGQRDWKVETPPAVVLTADRQRLTQALLQLAANAFEHTEVDQPITFGAGVESDSVHLWVRDEGSGVPDEIAADIFERFSRGSTEGHGFGLGLSIIMAIAEAHGGTVVLDHVSRGAQFRMILPKGPQ
ncbi:sensor histidine kinase [Brevibacterium sp. UCMA 11754]|uniref:sensor histidine kinase n=1 Tax=Brevibacterium sp. UCMA 11754 TaxID=2749198 RepID=UPI001F439489|nr:HAMP domain-containing sensor histidine kinase [Brevibacterium sp. UCMA 11754]MCF2571731.1 HAMP domain-containing histidine kinase [Brevibacterium sp. UCMA 11754]